jgi:hypothetical protein
MKIDSAKQPLTPSLVGTIRRFGKNGVLYEVLRQVDENSVMIHVLDTNEEVIYPTADALKDPNE